MGVGDSGFIVHAGCTPPHNRLKKFPLLLAVMLALTCQVANARIKRSQSAKAAFRQQDPCPATGARKGPCKGYVIDHVVPLACHGADAPSNM